MEMNKIAFNIIFLNKILIKIMLNLLVVSCNMQYVNGFLCLTDLAHKSVPGLDIQAIQSQQ